MILVDTSVWVRSMQPQFQDFSEVMRELLRADKVAAHDFVQGELMLGKSGNTRPQVLSAYLRLRFLETVPHKAVIDFIRKHKLENKGVGYVDAHLLAAADANDTELWTADPRLLQAARDLGVAYQPGK